MKEDFLHYVWKHQKVSAPLIPEQGYLISVFKPGSHNKHGGPDFEFAELILNDLRWVGAVEIHLRSSDWYHKYPYPLLFHPSKGTWKRSQ